MATIFIEGFDKYGPPGATIPSPTSALALGGWSAFGSFNNGVTFVSSLSGQAGYAVNINVNISGGLSRTLPANYSRVIGGYRFAADLVAGSGISFLDNATVQCSIYVHPTSGFIVIYQGNNTTLLQQSSASVAANVEHYLEWDITIGASGGWTVWLDGVQILAGTGNTQVSSNAYTNVLELNIYPVAGNAVGGASYDDMYLFDSTTSFNNSALLSNPLVLTQQPTADTQTQFTNEGFVFGNYTGESISDGPPGNFMILHKFLCPANCNIVSIVVKLNDTANPSSKFQGVVYANSSGSPGGLLGSSSVLTGFTTGQWLTLPISGTVSLTGGTDYFIGWMMDTSTQIQIATSNGVVPVGAYITFSSGPPNPAPSTGPIYGYPYICYAECNNVTTNWESVGLTTPLGDASSVATTTVNDEDLYSFPALPTGIATVYTVVVSGYVKLTSAGSNTFDLVSKSGTTTGAGSATNIAPTTTYDWYDSAFDTNPNGSAAWTPSAVNSASYGIKMTA